MNRDGIKEIIIRGKRFFCGATGNCSNWIYTKSGNQYKRILFEGGEELKVRKSLTNGYQDIYIRTHYSASESYHKIYRFRQGSFKEVKVVLKKMSVGLKNI